MLWSIAIAAPAVKRSRGIARDRRDRVSARDRKSKVHHGGAETRRRSRKNLPQMNADQRRSERRASRESTRKNPNNPGVTNGKSFRSGVDTGGTPAVGQRQSRENALKRHCHDSHARDLSTPPRSAGACSESLKMTRIQECGRKGTHARVSNEAQKKGHSPIERSGHRKIGISGHRDTGVSKSNNRKPHCLRASAVKSGLEPQRTQRDTE